MSHIHGYFKIVSLCYRNSSVCWFCCEPGVFLPVSPFTITGWDGDRARTRSLVVVQSWKNAQLLQTRLCYSSSLSCLYFAFVRAKHDFNTCSSKLRTSTDPGICFFLALCNMKSAFSRAILPHCLYYLVTLVLFFAPNF